MSIDLRDAYELVETKLKELNSWQQELSLREQDSMNHQEFLESVLISEVGKDSPHFKRLHDEFFHAGPISDLLEDENLNEIMVNSFDNIWIEASGRTARWQEQFLSKQSYLNFINRLLEQSDKSIDLDVPYVDGTWRGFRLHLVIPPLSPAGPCLTLRRHKIQAWSLEKLQRDHWAKADSINLLKHSVEQQKNILIIGTTGSGKTSCLNALLDATSPSERIISIEDSSELRPPNPVSVKLLTRHSSQGDLTPVDQATLIRQALRMNPDRIVMGEVRGEEAKDLLLALSTGHQGSLCTLHAHDPQQALWRLEMLVQMGAPQWSLTTIRRLIQSCIDLIVTVEKSVDGQRRLKAVHRICSLEESGFIVEPYQALTSI